MDAKSSPKKSENIVLIGMMFAGKSAVACKLGEQLRRRVYDTDDLVVQSAGESIASIWSREGESGFRRRELNVLRALCERAAGKSEPIVIATGGGTVTIPGAEELLRELGKVVYLEASAECLARRAFADGANSAGHQHEDNGVRPLLPGGPQGEDETRQTLVNILQARKTAYEACADFTVHAETAKPAEVADLILRKIDVADAASA